MKNLFKTGLLALVVSACISSCGDVNKAATKTPIDSPKVQIDTAKSAIKDTTTAIKKDSV